MSNSLRSNIASKTTFDALDVDSGEDTDEEQVSEQDSHSAQDRFVIDHIALWQMCQVNDEMVYLVQQGQRGWRNQL